MGINIIPYGKQCITDEDIEAVVKALKSDYLTQGPKIEEFESKFADYIGCKYAVAVANGTAALHLSALAVNIKEGQKVITTPITFAASANCIRYCGGEVVFSDINKQTYLLDIQKVRRLLESAPKGTYNGIIPVDFAGRATNLQEFRNLADEYGLWIIEDACHAPGGFFIDSDNQKQNCGNGKFADLSIFSFHPVKHIACGEGGMITTNNPIIYKRLLKLRSHGITKSNNEFVNDINWASGISNLSVENQNFPGWYMEMQELGYNYRLTDFQAALGMSQLNRADSGIEKRSQIAKKYNEVFSVCKFIKGQSRFLKGHAYHLYIIEVDNRLGLYNFLKENNIFAQIHYVPIHLMPYYKQFGWKIGDLPNAEEYYTGCISLPIYPTLTESDQDFVINKIKEFYNG